MNETTYINETKYSYINETKYCDEVLSNVCIWGGEGMFMNETKYINETKYSSFNSF